MTGVQTCALPILILLLCIIGLFIFGFAILAEVPSLISIASPFVISLISALAILVVSPVLGVIYGGFGIALKITQKRRQKASSLGNCIADSHYRESLISLRKRRDRALSITRDILLYSIAITLAIAFGLLLF